MKQLEVGPLRILQQATPTALRVDWEGRSGFRNPQSVLSPFFEALLEEGRATRATIEMHFEAVEYLNSSSVALLVRFLQHARDRAVNVCLHYSPTLRWQKLSFEALEAFEQEDGLIRIVPTRAGEESHS